MKEETVIPPPHLISQKLDKEYFDELLRENAELKRKIKALQNEIRDKSREFYGLSWIDVPEAFEEESKNKIPVLEEVQDKAVKNADGKPTHILIEGDNYHALTCLNYTHRGKIDVIYIDPPYNTGNDGFTYKDARFLTEFPDGAKIDKNHPLRHSAWLSFMAKRLELAKSLLSEKGVIFISIDDNEQANLKLLCDRVFGEENFISEFIWKSKQGKGGTTNLISNEHEYVLCYSRNIRSISLNQIYIKSEGRKENLRQWGQADKREDRPSMFYPICINGKEVFPIKEDNTEGRWRVSKETAKELLEKGELELSEKAGRLNIYRIFPAGFSVMPFGSIVPEQIGSTAKGSITLKNFGLEKAFAYPKSVEIISFLLNLLASYKITVLDFFAGSGTTMHATMKLNAEDGGKRQCILVTNNENQICEKVTYERNRRVMCGYVNSKGENVAGLGNSMKYYRTAFVGGNDAKNARDRDRRELSRKAGALLSLAENTLEELSVPEAEAAYFQIFSDGKYRFTAVYFALDWTHLDALVGTLKTLSAQTRGKARFAIYVYCDGAPDIFEDDLADVPGATLKAIPRPILEIYKTINGGK